MLDIEGYELTFLQLSEVSSPTSDPECDFHINVTLSTKIVEGVFT